MFNLVLKDILLQKKTLLIMLPIFIIYLFTGFSITWIGFIFCIAIIMNAFSYDEKPSINILLNSLPYTRREIVSSKYVGACVFTLIILFTMFIGNLMINNEVMPLKQLLFILSMVAVFISFAFPFSFQFKSQYLLIAFAILFVGYFVMIGVFIPDLNDRIRYIVHLYFNYNNLLVYLITIIIVLILYILSWMISIRIYKKKVF